MNRPSILAIEGFFLLFTFYFPFMKTFYCTILIALLFTSFAPRQITWVAIGDSITYLNDHSAETGNRVQQGYMSRVVQQLPNIHYINQGHNGWTSGGIASSIDKLGLVKADVYTIFLGTNDWWQGRPIGTLNDYITAAGNATVYGSFRIITDKLKALNPAAKVIMITPMQRVDFVYLTNMKNNAYGSYKAKNNQTLQQFANAIIAIANYEQYAIADLYNNRRLSHPRLVKFKRVKDPATGEYRNYTYPKFIDVPFDPAKDEYPYPDAAINMTYDGLHPSDKGNEEIAKVLVKMMRKY
jgi:lysophospholipase L1-like esterase